VTKTRPDIQLAAFQNYAEYVYMNERREMQKSAADATEQTKVRLLEKCLPSMRRHVQSAVLKARKRFGD